MSGFGIPIGTGVSSGFKKYKVKSDPLSPIETEYQMGEIVEWASNCKQIGIDIYFFGSKFKTLQIYFSGRAMLKTV